MRTHRLNSVFGLLSLLALTPLASGGRVSSGTVEYTANPCLVEDARFQSRHGGCYDSQTNLVWSMNAGNPQRAGGIWDYPSATTYSTNLVEGGYGDWRLPTLADLRGVAGNAAAAHLNVFYNSNVQNPDGTYGGQGDYPMYSTTAGKKGQCKTVVAKQLNAGAESNWGTAEWPKACSSATDFVCVRVHQLSDPD